MPLLHFEQCHLVEGFGRGPGGGRGRERREEGGCLPFFVRNQIGFFNVLIFNIF